MTRRFAAKLVGIASDHYWFEIPRFHDVLNPHPFFSFVQQVTLRDEPITYGCDSSSAYPVFCPDDKIPRGKLAAFFIRAMKRTPQYTDNQQVFADVPIDHKFYAEIRLLKELGIVQGESDTGGGLTRYRPDDEISRAEMAAILIRARDLDLGACTNSEEDIADFLAKISDVGEQNTFFREIVCLSKLKITDGYGDGTFKPEVMVDRAQAAKFMALAYPVDVSLGIQEDDDEKNNRPETAPELIRPDQYRFWVPSGDIDYLVLPTPDTLGDETEYVFSLQRPNTYYNADVLLEVLDSDAATVLDSIQISAEEPSKELRWAPSGNGRHYVRLSNAKPFATGAVETYLTVEMVFGAAQGDLIPGEELDLDFRGEQATGIEVSVAADAVADVITLVYDPNEEPGKVPEHLTFAGQAFSLDAYREGQRQNSFEFDQPVTVKVIYDETEMNPGGESKLVLAYWNGQTWIDVASTCSPSSTYVRNLESNTLEVNICHLSDFALFADDGSATNLNNIYLPMMLK